MKSICAFSWILCQFMAIAVAATQSLNQISEKLLELDQTFKSQGPTISILQQYDSVISELHRFKQQDDPLFVAFEANHMPNIYYKKGLIEFSLDKELFAIESFEKCHEMNKSMDPCTSKLASLYLKNGKLDKLKALLETPAARKLDEDVAAKSQLLRESVEAATQHMDKKEYARCVEHVSEAIKFAPSFNELRQLRINCLEQSRSELPYEKKLTFLIEDYQELVKNGQYAKTKDIRPSNGFSFKNLFYSGTTTVPEDAMDPLGNFIKLAKLLLFGNANFEQASKILQKCLRVDNDCTGCQVYSKVLVKLNNKFISLFEKGSIYYSHVYLQRTDNEQDSSADTFQIQELELQDDEWIQIYAFLFEAKDKLKISKSHQDYLNIQSSTFRNNYEFLLNEITKFQQEFNFGSKVLDSENTESSFAGMNVFKRDLSKLTAEALVMSEKQKLHKTVLADVCSAIEDDDFLPCRIHKVDQLLAKPAKAEYMKALKLLNAMGPRLKKTKLWKLRFNQIQSRYPSEDARSQQRRQQQQQQHRQYQNSYQQQQFFNGHNQKTYHQRQSAPPPSHAPDVDYYKTLDIPKDADEATIKKSYRDKVKQFHPDKNKNSDFTKEQLEQKMSDINNAYEVLSDKDKKQEYDMQRAGRGGPRMSGGFRGQRGQQQQQQQHYQGGGSSGFGGGGGFDFRQFFQQQQQQHQQQQQQHQQRQQQKTKQGGKRKN